MNEFQDGTLITMEVMGCQVQAIGKAIRLLFADPVTYVTVLLEYIDLLSFQEGAHVTSVSPFLRDECEL